MEWVNEPQGPTTRDACPIYFCVDRQTENDGPCAVYICMKKFCFINY